MLSVCRKLLSVSFNEWSLGTSSITEEARLGEFESVADFFNTSFFIYLSFISFNIQIIIWKWKVFIFLKITLIFYVPGIFKFCFVFISLIGI
jgi:hypothetical protein